MSAKPLFAAALLLTALGLGAARGQAPEVVGGTPLDTGTLPGGLIGWPPRGMVKPKPPSPDEGPPASSLLPDYVTYSQPGCCGPLGDNGPVLEEVYGRTGLSFPVAGHIFGHTLEMGWEIGAGGRTMFYNPSLTGAWAVDVGLSNIFNTGQHSDIQIPLSVLVPTSTGPTRVNFGTDPGVPGVTVKDLNRTLVNLGGGREFYLVGAANSPGTRWHTGLDLGGLYGSEKIEYHEIQHRSKVLEGGYAALHTDVEIPCCSVVFLIGIRAEWTYFHSQLLQQGNDSDVQDLDLLFTAGVRF